MNRRSFLAVVATGTTCAVAGCSSTSDPSPPEELDGVDADADQLPTPTIASGPVSIDVYEDLGCPSCHEFQASVFPDLERELLETEEATYRHVDFPLPADDRSVAMANAARAVQAETGTDDDPAGDFFAYKTAVINADDWSDDALASIAAAEAGVDEAVVEDALDNGTYYPTLKAGWEQAIDAGAEGTPTVAVDGEIVDDPFDVSAIVDAVRNA